MPPTPRIPRAPRILTAVALTAAAVVVPATTATTAVAAPAHLGAFPFTVPTAADKLGVPPGTALTEVAGSVTITTPGTVLTKRQFDGTVVVATPAGSAPVVISDSRFAGGPDYGLLVRSGSVRVDHSTWTEAADHQAAGPNLTISRSVFQGSHADGIVPSSGSTLTGNWIHAFDPSPGTHADGIQIQDGVTDVVIQGNRVDPGDTLPGHGAGTVNSALFLSPSLGPDGAGPLQVRGNYVDGGNFTLYFVNGAGGRYVQTGLSFLNNQFGPTHQYGYDDVDMPGRFAGNVDPAGNHLDLP